MYSTEKLKQVRKEKGYSIYQMAELLGVTASFYCQIENKKRRLFYDVAVAIANIFETTPDELFYDGEY